MSIIQIPPDAKTLEMSNSIIWFEDGILYSKPKSPAYILVTREQMEEDVKKMRAFVGDQKVFMIAEAHPKTESPRKEDQDFIASEIGKLVKALAIITPNALSRMVANLFFLFKPPAYPVKMFVSVSDARHWLKTALKNGKNIPMI